MMLNALARCHLTLLTHAKWIVAATVAALFLLRVSNTNLFLPLLAMAAWAIAVFLVRPCNQRMHVHDKVLGIGALPLVMSVGLLLFLFQASLKHRSAA